MASNILAKIAVQISANTAEFNKALSKTSKDISSFTGGITKLAGTLGVAFGVQQITDFVFEISKLAGEAEGVENAFNRLQGSKKLLLDLKEATKGTVSELNLMKRAVQFSNFGLELSKLPTLLEFATKRAQATGQSVDYLVDSIVTGLGRKSVLILDNLGISAIQLREEMAKVGDITVAVSNIIEKDVANSGDIIETVALRTERLSASWDNFKVSIGKAANGTGILGTALESLNEILIVLASSTLNAGEKIVFITGNEFQKAAILTEHYAKEIAEANRQTERQAFVNKQAADAFKLYNGNLEEFKKHIAPAHANTKLLIEAFQKLTKEQKDQISLQGTLQGAMEEQAILQKQKLTLTGTELAKTNIRLQQLDEEIRLLNELGLAQNKLKTPSIFDRTDIPNFDLKFSAIGTLVDIPKLKENIDETVKQVKRLPESFHFVADQMIDITGTIVGGIASIADAIGEAAVMGGRDFGRAFLRALGSFAQQFGSLLIAAGVGQIALRSGNPALMIAAGAALVAIGGAIKALTSNPPSMSGASAQSANFNRPSIGNNQFSNVNVNGEFVIQGSSLVAVLNNANSDNGRRKN